MKKSQATARVQITVEFAVGGSVWGDDASVGQVYGQAREAALDILRRGLVIDGMTVNGFNVKTRAEIVGEPVIKAILFEEQR